MCIRRTSRFLSGPAAGLWRQDITGRDFIMTVTNLLKLATISVVVGLTGCASRTVVVRERVVRHETPVVETVVETPPPVVETVVEEPVVEIATPVIEVIIERPTEVVVTTFHNDLLPHGYWVDIPEYGRCWRPARVDKRWRPYTVGHWVWTDAGWSWESEEAWGYATYHYGRWFEDRKHGWVWMPGTTWAPAWVAWRSGGGYIGWAPLGPTVRDTGEVHITEYETRGIPATNFNFVEEKRVTEPSVH